MAAGFAAFFAIDPHAEPPEVPPATHFVLDAPEDWVFRPWQWPVPSPDGRHVVIKASRAADGDDGAMLWLRSLDSPAFRPLDGSEGTSDPFWSPDSQFVGFCQDGELRKLNLSDGAVQTICRFQGRGCDADWNEEGTILFASWPRNPDLGSGGLYAVSASGGEPQLVMRADAARKERLLDLPRFLPGGRRFLFAAVGGESGPSDTRGYHVSTLTRPDERRQVTADLYHLEPARGRAFFNRGDTLFTQPFDSVRAELLGEQAPIAFSVAGPVGADVGSFSVSSGTLAWLSGESESRLQLAWVNRTGERIETVGPPEFYAQIALSPDGRRIAAEVVDVGAQQVDLWVMDVSRGIPSRLTSEAGSERDPVWSPDSQEVVFKSIEGNDHRLFRKGLRGEPAVPVAAGGEGDSVIPESWSRDGKTLIYKTLQGTTAWALPMDGGGDAEAVLEVGVIFDEPQISPDGRWLAYHSEESGEGEWEVYVQPFRREGERVRVSVDGGSSPQWRGDGKELFYVARDGRLMAVDVEEGAEGPKVELPRSLFRIERTGSVHTDDYAVRADGQRFLVKQRLEAEQELQMHVVVNWPSLLEQTGE